MKRECHDIDYCGICNYFKNTLFYENYDAFQDNYRENMKETFYCDFFIWPIKLTKTEYENIPNWCPLDELEE